MMARKRLGKRVFYIQRKCTKLLRKMDTVIRQVMVAATAAILSMRVRSHINFEIEPMDVALLNNKNLKVLTALRARTSVPKEVIMSATLPPGSPVLIFVVSESKHLFDEFFSGQICLSPSADDVSVTWPGLRTFHSERTVELHDREMYMK